MDPIPTGIGCDVRPQLFRLRGGAGESSSQICRYFWFRFLCCRRDLDSDNVASGCSRSFAQFLLYFEPVTLLAIRLEHGLKIEAVHRAFDRRHAARWEPRTGALWQYKKCPVCLGAFRGTEELRFETNFTNGLGHFA